jgi:hypothetical protein
VRSSNAHSLALLPNAGYIGWGYLLSVLDASSRGRRSSRCGSRTPIVRHATSMYLRPATRVMLQSRELLSEVCAVQCPDDGVTFDLSALVIEPIRVEEEYAGVRSLFWAHLGGARIRMQVDIGIGDALTSQVDEIEYPAMLPHLPRANIRAYPRETAVAEKFEAMVKLGRRNSRMKDFHDVYALSAAFTFDGAALLLAIKGCFDRRGTPLSAERPDALTTAFYQDEAIQKRWQAYSRSSNILVAPPTRFDEIGGQITRFLGPVRDSIVAGEVYTATWTAERLWSAKTIAGTVQT